MITQTPSTERDLGRVEGKLDLVLQSFVRFEEKLDKRETAHDGHRTAFDARLTALERKVLVLAISLASTVMAGAGLAAKGSWAVIAGLLHAGAM